MNDKLKDVFQRYYNYLKENIDMSSLCLSSNLSIDYVKMFYFPKPNSTHNIIMLMSSSMDSWKMVYPKIQHYVCTKTVNGLCSVIRVTLCFKKGFFLGTSIKVEHPDIPVLDFVEATFGVDYSVNCVEYSVDIDSADHKKLFNLIRNTAWLKWSKQQLNLPYETSHYLNNPRKSSKGCYAYIKSVNGKGIVRIEMRLKGAKFRSLKIKKVKVAVMMDPLIVFSGLQFLYLDAKKFYSKIKNKHKISPKVSQDLFSSFELMLVGVYINNELFDEKGQGFVGIRLIAKHMLNNTVGCYREYPLQEEFTKLLTGKKFI